MGKEELMQKLILALERENEQLRKQVAELQGYNAELRRDAKGMEMELAKVRKERDEWEQNAIEAGELYCELEREIGNMEIVCD